VIGLTVVIPVFGCDNTLIQLLGRIQQVGLEGATTVLLILDSYDQEKEQLARQVVRDFDFVVLFLSEGNFGQHAGIRFGLSWALERGTDVVVMDCDLQDEPELLPELIATSDGLTAVVGRRSVRSARHIDSLTSRTFALLLRALSGDAPSSSLSAFSYIPKMLISEVLNHFTPRGHYLHALLQSNVLVMEFDYSRKPRVSGRSSYAAGKRFTHALNGVVSWSTKPLRAVVWLSTVGAAWAVCVTLWVFYRAIFAVLEPGWASLMVTVSWGFAFSLGSLAMIGLYLENAVNLLRGGNGRLRGRFVESEEQMDHHHRRDQSHGLGNSPA